VSVSKKATIWSSSLSVKPSIPVVVSRLFGTSFIGQQVTLSIVPDGQCPEYRGFGFRDLAAEIGIKSASVHHHFPTKAKMAAAVARRYGDRFLAAVARRPNERAEDAISAYRSAFRAALDRDGRMCLCGVLAAEAGVL